MSELKHGHMSGTTARAKARTRANTEIRTVTEVWNSSLDVDLGRAFRFVQDDVLLWGN
jgi:hypothetical protein